MPTFYLDLDRTLFRTERAHELLDVVQEAYPDNEEMQEGHKKRPNFCVFPHQDEANAKTYYYDFIAHLKAAGLNHGEVFERIRPALSDGRFEYEGVAKLIRELQALGEVAILTYGEDIYQRYKASLCPSLEGLPITTVLEPKAQFLNEHAGTGDWMVDDKIIHGLESGVRAIRIQHDSNDIPADARSLQEVSEHIHRAAGVPKP